MLARGLARPRYAKLAYHPPLGCTRFRMILFATSIRIEPIENYHSTLRTIARWLNAETRLRLTADDLASGAPIRTLTGRIQTAVAERDGEQFFAVRYSRPDEAQRGLTWSTEVGVHSPGRRLPLLLTVVTRAETLSPFERVTLDYEIPRVLTYVLDGLAVSAETPGIEPRVLRTGADLRALRVWLASARRLHTVVLLSPAPDGTTVVDPEALNDFLAGVAEVAVMAPDLDKRLVQPALGVQLAVFNGELALVFPAAQQGNDTRVTRRILRLDDLVDLHDEDGGLHQGLFRIIAQRTNVLHLRRHIDLEHVLAIGSGGASPPHADLTELLNLLDEQQAENDALREELQRNEDALRLANNRSRALQATLAYLDGDVRYPTNGNPQLIKDAFLAQVGDRVTLSSALHILAEVFPDRLVVLPSAFASAEESAKFKYRRRAFDLLWTLATDYWQALADGKGNTQARTVFGYNAFSARESETAANTDRAVRLRTFVYNGTPIYMDSHLKIGNSDSAAETLRVHFAWIADEQKIVIGHCGKHLDLS